VTPRPTAVLLVDSNPHEAAELREKLSASCRATFTSRIVSTLAEALVLLADARFDAVLVDLDTAGSEWAASLKKLQRSAPETSIIAMDGIEDETKALEVVRAGAQDYFPKERVTSAALQRILLYCIERQRARTRNALHSSVSQVLAASQSVPDTETAILRVLCQFLEFDYGEFWRLDSVANKLVHHQSWHLPSRDLRALTAVAHSMQFSKGQGVAGRVWATGAPVWVECIDQEPSMRQVRVLVDGGFNSALAVPIMLGADILGVMEFFGREAQQADEELLRVIAAIGSQVGQFLAGNWSRRKSSA